MKLIKVSKGFSLIEILVATSIIITATTMVVAILASTFRTSVKTTSTETVRQNGTNAMNQVSRLIQFADSFKGASVDDSGASSYDDVCPAENTEYHYIKISSGGVTKKLSCTDTELAVDGASLLDKTKVNIVSCQFSCSQGSAVVSPVIGISLNLLLKNSGSVPEKNAAINFSTSVKMRNL